MAKRAKKITFNVEIVKVSDLKPHPKNYREHTQEQLDHIVQSIRDNGFYKNIVISRDMYILAGHGVWMAVQIIGYKEVPVRKLNINHNHPRARQILTGDNEIAKLAEVNDRELTDLLKGIRDEGNLLGTGFDEQTLSALLFVTRPAEEIAEIAREEEWVGMPEFGGGYDPLKMTVQFENEKDRQDFATRLGITLSDKQRSMWWPWKEREDLASLIFEG